MALLLGASGTFKKWKLFAGSAPLRKGEWALLFPLRIVSLLPTLAAMLSLTAASLPCHDGGHGFICQNQSFLHRVALVKPSVPTACKKKKKKKVEQ